MNKICILILICVILLSLVGVADALPGIDSVSITSGDKLSTVDDITVSAHFEGDWGFGLWDWITGEGTRGNPMNFFWEIEVYKDGWLLDSKIGSKKVYVEYYITDSRDAYMFRLHEEGKDWTEWETVQNSEPFRNINNVPVDISLGTGNYDIYAKVRVGTYDTWPDIYADWKTSATSSIQITSPEDSTSPPSVTTNSASGITTSSAILNGHLDSTGGESCQVWFEYGKTAAYGSSTSKQSKSSPSSFSSVISGLDDDTTYHFRAVASNSKGTRHGSDMTFKTDLSTGSIYATSTPSGANVYLDGVSQGTSPATIPDVSVGSHTVKFTKSGYADCVQTKIVKAATSHQVHCNLVPVQQTGSIYATSSPSGANVYLDGVPQGTSPKTIPDVSVGSHTVKFTKSGYNDCTKTVTVSADQQMNVYCALVQIPQTGSIYATSSPSGANVYLDGTYKGTTSKTIPDVSVGSHTVKFTKSGYNDCTKTVTVSADQQMNVYCALVQIPQTGSIYATSSPSGANVYLDGTYKGTTSKTIPDVSVGSHTVKFTKSGYNDCTKTVTVSADQQMNVYCALVQIPQTGSIYATSSPSGANVYLDGTYKGTTSKTIPDVSVGSHTVKFTKSGYNDCTKTVTVSADQQMNVYCALVQIPQTGSIYATSSPSGANVYLDGTYKGTTSKTIPDVSVGSHTVKFTKSGYNDCTKTVTVSADQQMNVYCALVQIPQTGSIYATSSPSGANVYLDGTYKGTTSKTIPDVSVGSHTVKFTKSGYNDCTKTVTVSADQQMNVYCALVQTSQTGTIYATSSPSGANVYLDGTYKGTTSKTIPDVSVGSHTVKFTKSGYNDCTKTVTVSADQQMNVYCALVQTSQTGTIYATSSPSGANVYLDGTYKGTTSKTIPDVSVGSHTVKFTKSGYNDCTKTVTVSADQQMNVYCALVQTSQTGTIYATSSPSGANVYLDGTYKGTTSKTIPDVSVGSHTVKFTKSGYNDCTKTVTVSADQQMNVYCALVQIPQTGSIYATSSPSGANVYLDGTYKGTTSKTIPDVSVGSHTVKFTKSGYNDCTKTVTVSADQQMNVYCALVQIPQTGSIYATSSPSGANVYLDGTYKGTTSKTIPDVSVGSHTVKFTKSGYNDCTKTVTVSADQQMNVYCALVQTSQTGTIYATSSPSGANVYLDGTYKGTTSKTIPDVSVGSHTVKFTKSGYNDCTKTVTVSADQQMNVYCALVQIPQTGSIYATSSPSGANVYLDGTYKGTTSKTIPDVSVGSHTVKFTKSGYNDCTKTVTVSADQQMNVYCALVQTSQTGTIYATSSPSGANVYLDGTYKGTTSKTIPDVSVGSHTVKFTKSGYNDCTKTVTVSADQQMNVYCALVQTSQTGTIYATSSPSGANVYLDGTYKGTTSKTIPDVSVGSHTVKFTKSGYNDCTKTVTVNANKQTNVHCALVQTPQITIQLNTGWNLISLPKRPHDTDVLDVLSSLAGNWNSVWSYETGNWKRYDLTGPDFLNDLTTIEPGNGYWIDMKSKDTLSVSGSEPTTKSISLSAGWNLVGYNSLSSKSTTFAMNSVTGNWNSVWSYETGNWKRYDLTGPDFLNDLTILEPGKGYWIDMKSSDTWTLGGGLL